jgi:hypothetical protein
MLNKYRGFNSAAKYVLRYRIIFFKKMKLNYAGKLNQIDKKCQNS